MFCNLSSYFEWSGRALFSRIKLPLFLILLAFPPLISGLWLTKEKTELENTQSRFSLAMRKSKTALERMARKELFLQRHTQPNPYFLDTEIESLSFLEKEKAELEHWLVHPAIAQKERLSQRLHFLNNEENRLFFAEEDIQFSDFCKETLEKQRYPVQMDNADLKNLLTLIEDPAQTQSQRPQLLITDFTLRKIVTPLQNEVFEVNIDLLKRELL